MWPRKREKNFRKRARGEDARSIQLQSDSAAAFVIRREKGLGEVLFHAWNSVRLIG